VAKIAYHQSAPFVDAILGHSGRKHIQLQSWTLGHLKAWSAFETAYSVRCCYTARMTCSHRLHSTRSRHLVSCCCVPV